MPETMPETTTTDIAAVLGVTVRWLTETVEALNLACYKQPTVSIDVDADGMWIGRATKNTAVYCYWPSLSPSVRRLRVDLDARRLTEQINTVARDVRLFDRLDVFIGANELGWNHHSGRTVLAASTAPASHYWRDIAHAIDSAPRDTPKIDPDDLYPLSALFDEHEQVEVHSTTAGVRVGCMAPDWNLFYTIAAR
jgi:hypothetical protein